LERHGLLHPDGHGLAANWSSVSCQPVAQLDYGARAFVSVFAASKGDKGIENLDGPGEDTQTHVIG
jgi:hypothetical protein